MKCNRTGTLLAGISSSFIEIFLKFKTISYIASVSVVTVAVTVVILVADTAGIIGGSAVTFAYIVPGLVDTCC